MGYRLSNTDIEKGINLLLQDKTMGEASACLNAIYQDLEGQEMAENFHRRHMTPSCGVITVFDKERVINIGYSAISIETS